MNIGKKIADAVVSAISSATLNEEVSVTRVTDPDLEIAELETPEVTVYPGPTKSVRVGRDQWGHESTIIVQLRCRLPVVPTGTEIDAQAEVLQQIEDIFLQRSIDALSHAIVLSAVITPYDGAHLVEENIYRGEITLVIKS